MQKSLSVIKSIIKAKLIKQPYKLNFAITSQCNSRCKTCNVWKDYQKNPQKAKEDLSLAEIKKIFTYLPDSFIWLSLSGGEPFLRNDLVKICQTVVSQMPQLNLISIPTNGLLGNEIIAKCKQILKLPVKNLFLNFSIDGPEKVHDEIRGIEGSFKKTWDTYNKAIAIAKDNPRFNVNIETTISRYNINHLNDFFRKLSNDGHKITVTLAHSGYLYKNLKKKNDYTRFNHNDELPKIIKTVKNNLSYLNPHDLIERIYLNKILYFYQKPKQQALPCMALSSSFALDNKGNITPCFMWGKLIANIKDFDYKLGDLWQNKSALIKRTRNTIIQQKCPNCWTPCEAYQAIINNYFSRRAPFLLKLLN